MLNGNFINCLNELICISDNILLKSQEINKDLNLNSQDNNNINQFLIDLCFDMKKINNNLKLLLSSYNNSIDSNYELENKIKSLQNQNFCLETSLLNSNHKIQDLNSIIIEKESLIQELSNLQNNLCVCNCNCPCYKLKNDNINNYNKQLFPLEISNYNYKSTKSTNFDNNVYSNNKGSLTYDYNSNSNSLRNSPKRNLSFDYGKKCLYDNNDNIVNKTSNILNSYTNQLYNNYPSYQNSTYSNYKFDNNNYLNEDYNYPNNNKSKLRDYYIQTNNIMNNDNNNFNNKNYMISYPDNSSLVKNNSINELNEKQNMKLNNNNKVKNNNYNLENENNIIPRINNSNKNNESNNTQNKNLNDDINEKFLKDNKEKKNQIYNFNIDEPEPEIIKTIQIQKYNINNNQNLKGNILNKNSNYIDSPYNSNFQTIQEKDMNPNLNINKNIKLSSIDNSNNKNEDIEYEINDLNKINNNINENKKNMNEEKSKKNKLMKNKINRVQKIIQESFKDENTLKKLKEKLGSDFIEKITNEKVTEEFLNEVENKIKEINEENKDNIINIYKNYSSKSYNSNNIFLPKKKYKDPILNMMYDKRKLKKENTDKQYHFKENPKGWISSKDYFLNNNSSDGKIEKSPYKIPNQIKMKNK